MLNTLIAFIHDHCHVVIQLLIQLHTTVIQLLTNPQTTNLPGSCFCSGLHDLESFSFFWRPEVAEVSVTSRRAVMWITLILDVPTVEQ